MSQTNDSPAMQIYHRMRHTAFRLGRLSIWVVWSNWWLRYRLPWVAHDRVGGTVVVRLGPLFGSWRA